MSRRKSVRQIAREQHHNRRTIRSALEDAGPGRYTLAVPRQRPVLGPVIGVIDRWFEDDKTSPPTQRHTDIYMFCLCLCHSQRFCIFAFPLQSARQPGGGQCALPSASHGGLYRQAMLIPGCPPGASQAPIFQGFDPVSVLH